MLRPSAQAPRPRLLVLLPLLLLALAGPPARAQGGVDYTGTGGGDTVQGRLIFPSGRRADIRLKVKLASTGAGDLSVLTDANGSFGFRSLRPGHYTLIIEGGEQFESVQESIYIEPHNISSKRGTSLPPLTRPYTVQIYLRPKRVGREEGKTGVVNALLASVPKAAVDLYRKGVEAGRKAGGVKTAIEHLKAAVALHPDFALAHNELGVQYLRAGQADKAAESLRAALKLTPEEFSPRLNYGIALSEQKKFAEAEAELRKALLKNDSSPAAHYYLGVALHKQRKFPDAKKEFERTIELAGDALPPAYYYLGGICWAEGEYKRAADSLETYLRLVPDAPDAERIRGTIKQLRDRQ